MVASLPDPVLSLALNNISKISSIDADNLSTMWTVFTKCKDNLENGRRLENLSWRLWYRETILLEKEKNALSDEDTQIQDIDDTFANRIVEQFQLSTITSSAMNIPTTKVVNETNFKSSPKYFSNEPQQLQPIEENRSENLSSNHSSNSSNHSSNHSDISSQILINPHQPPTLRPVSKRIALKHLNPTSFHRIITSFTPANSENSDPWKRNPQQPAGAAGFSAPDQLDPNPLTAVSPPKLDIASVERISSMPVPGYSRDLKSNEVSIMDVNSPSSIKCAPTSVVIRGFDSSKTPALNHVIENSNSKSKRIFFMPSSMTSSDGDNNSYTCSSKLSNQQTGSKLKHCLKNVSNVRELKNVSNVRELKNVSNVRELKYVSNARESLPRMNVELEKITSVLHVNHYMAHSMDSETDLDNISRDPKMDDLEMDDESDWDSDCSSEYSSSLDDLDDKCTPVFTKLDRPPVPRCDSKGLLSTMFEKMKIQSTKNIHVINRSQTMPHNLSSLKNPELTKTLPISVTQSLNTSYAGGAFSPRTTRRNMLATELSESLRRNLLWERQQRNMMTGKSHRMTRRHTSGAVRQMDAEPPKRQMSSKEIASAFTRANNVGVW